MTQIKNIHGEVLYEREGSLKEVLEKASRTGKVLRYADLTGVDLSGVDLSRTDLGGVDLSGADLTEANLEGAKFWLGNLTGANFRKANLKKASLEGTNLIGTNFTETDLSDTVLDPKNKPNQENSEIFDRMPSGRLIGYRTRKSHVGGYEYIPGKVYKAPYFSTCRTPCHPGLYVFTCVHDPKDMVRVSFKVEDLHYTMNSYRVREFRVLKRNNGQ